MPDDGESYLLGRGHDLMGRGARVTDLPTEDIEDIWAEMDDLSDEIEGVKDSVGLLLMSDEQSWWPDE